MQSQPQLSHVWTAQGRDLPTSWSSSLGVPQFRPEAEARRECWVNIWCQWFGSAGACESVCCGVCCVRLLATCESSRWYRFSCTRPHSARRHRKLWYPSTTTRSCEAFACPHRTAGASSTAEQPDSASHRQWSDPKLAMLGSITHLGIDPNTPPPFGFMFNVDSDILALH